MKSYILTGLAWGAAMVAVSCGIVLYAIGLLPESNQIPLHFGADGMPDRFGNRSDALIVLWLLPCGTAVVSAIMAIAPFLDPRKQNLAVGRKAYVVTWISVTTLMALVTAGVAFGMVKGAGQPFNTSGMVRWIIAGVAVLFIVMGNYLPKTRSSFIFGVRTPWTLSSDIAWEKTHRLAGPPVHDCGRPGTDRRVRLQRPLPGTAIDRPDPERRADPVRLLLFRLVQRR
jgi:uncharacterized membrane protein